MNKQLRDALSRLFDKHRLVFWYDESREMREEFEALQMEGMEKLEIANNAFGLCYRIHTAPSETDLKGHAARGKRHQIPSYF